MAVEVILPKVDMDMATGQISRWFFKEGDTVKQGDVLFEIETDKAAMEIDAPASGILRNITGKEGVDIPVGHAVAWIYAEGEDASAAPAAAPAAEVKSEKPESSSPESSSQDRSAQTAPAVQDTPVQAGAVRATPLARRLAREAGLDLSGISGSGPQGRVVKADVEAAIAGGGVKAPAVAPAGEAAAPAAVAPAVKPMSDEAVLKLFEEGSYELIPHDNMRRTIARRLVEAKSTVP
ncbi:E3 binding domain-containing protein, partial [Aquamicrobium defluvii]